MSAEPPDAGLLRAGPAHAPAMAAIHEAAFPPAERWGAAAIATTLALPGVLGLLAPAGGMALAQLAADEAELLTLAVLPARQRRGLGRRLLAAAMAQAAAQRSVAMFLEVKASNDGALALYRRAGFAPVGMRRQYYADGADALVLRVPLGATPCG